MFRGKQAENAQLKLQITQLTREVELLESRLSRYTTGPAPYRINTDVPLEIAPAVQEKLDAYQAGVKLQRKGFKGS